MSTGGIFKLIVNTGVQDKLLMATDYLNARIAHISQRNIKQMEQKNAFVNKEMLDLDNSWIPEMNIIEKSHVIFVNGSFKPFVSCGFEYNLAQSKGKTGLGQEISFTLPVFGEFVNDAVVHIKLKGLAANDIRDRVRYVSMLGHKLMTKTSFKVGANPLDEYYSEDYNNHFEFHVPPGKKNGWLRNIGQEIPTMGHITADPTYDFQREYRWFGFGNQTFKQSHDEIELWIPLIFWFQDVRNSIPNFLMPYGQTDIIIQLASASDIVGFLDNGGGGAYTAPTISLCELYVNNIFLMPEISKLFTKKFGFSLIRTHGRHTQELQVSSQNVHLNSLKWPTECLYVSFRPKANLAMSQYWHKSSTLTLTNVKVPVVAKNSALVTTGNFGATTSTTAVVVFGTGPTPLSAVPNLYVNYDLTITGGTGYNDTDIMQNRYTVTAYSGATNVITVAGWSGDTPDTTTTYDLFTPEVAINIAQIYKESPTIDNLELSAHDIKIFRKTSESFFNSYLPYRFGEKINTPEDRGRYFMNFNFHPGDHNPSGHVNISKAREFYLRYEGTLISGTNVVDLIVSSRAINFLLIDSGSCVLRYST
jgi:hypothetical protein